MAKTKVRRVRVCVRLSVELRAKLAKYCAASGISERTVIEDALQKHLGNESDTALLLRRFDRVERDMARDHRDLELLSEAFGRYMRLWFGSACLKRRRGRQGRGTRGRRGAVQAVRAALGDAVQAGPSLYRRLPGGGVRGRRRREVVGGAMARDAWSSVRPARVARGASHGGKHSRDLGREEGSPHAADVSLDGQAQGHRPKRQADRAQLTNPYIGSCVDVDDRRRAQAERERQDQEQIALARQFSQWVLSIVSHDILNPLAAIDGSARVLAGRAKDDPALRKIAERISRNVDRIMHIVRDLLDFSRDRYGLGIPVVLAPADMHGMLPRRRR